MKKFFTLFFAAGLLAASAQAADYISAPMSVSPASGTIMAGMGDIDIQWRGVDLKVADTGTHAKNYIDLSYVTVYLNGEENKAWQNYMDAGLYAHHIELSNEQTGGDSVTDGGYVLTLYLGTMSYFWRGDINITIKEGAVETTTGEINPEINLTYYVKEATTPDQISFSPQNNSEFEEGSGVITVTWNIEGDLTFANESTTNIFAIGYDAEGGPTERFQLTDYCKIDNNALIVSLEALPEGKYSLVIPEGTFFIGQNYINLESATYDFKVIGDPSGVKSILNQNESSVIYDLNGRVVRNPSNGIYIINGKKIKK